MPLVVLDAEFAAREREDIDAFVAGHSVGGIEPSVVEHEGVAVGSGGDLKRGGEVATACRGEIPYCSSYIAHERVGGLIAEGEGVARLIVGMGHEVGAVDAVVGAVSAYPLDVIEGGPVVESVGEIVGALRLIEPVDIKGHNGSVERVLTYGSHNLARLNLDKLSLMHAAVDATASQGIVALIAHRVEHEFAESGPCGSVVVGYGHMGHVAVGKHIIPHTVGRRELGQGSGVAPEKEQSSVGEAPYRGHGYSAVEAGGLRLAPCQAAIG